MGSMGSIVDTAAGRALFAVAMAGTGVLSLVYGDFALQWQPLPAGFPARTLLAQGSGLLIVASAIGVFFKRTAVVSASVLCLYQLVWAVLRIAEVPPDWFSIGRWLGFCEAFAILIAAGTLLRSVADPAARARSALHPIDWLAPAQRLFGLCCIGFGLSHFAYAEFTAAMIPQWLPGRLWLAFFTGAGHIAAGLGLLAGIVPRVAATLEAIMMSSFVVLVHVPSLFAAPPVDWAPTSRMQWTALCMSGALAGSAWLVAGSIPDRR